MTPAEALTESVQVACDVLKERGHEDLAEAVAMACRIGQRSRRMEQESARTRLEREILFGAHTLLSAGIRPRRVVVGWSMREVMMRIRRDGHYRVLCARTPRTFDAISPLPPVEEFVLGVEFDHLPAGMAAMVKP